MDTKVSLLEEIKKGGYEASLITTFNAYLPFYEDVILRKFVSNGVRHNVLMMDARQCQHCFDTHPPSSAGRRYSLVPMRTAGAFHPKIILLVGKKKGLLSVGSHNLTLSGFGTNRELTNLIRYSGDKEDGSVGAINQVWHFIESWVKEQGDRLPPHFSEMVSKVKSFSPWLTDDAASAGDIEIIATSPDRPSLWGQLTPLVADPVRRVLVGGAFFDSDLAFVKQLRNEFDQAEIFIGVDPATVKAPPALSLLENVRVVNAADVKPDGEDDDKFNGYLHAKSLVIETEGDRTLLITGSANPSAPAWLSRWGTGNTEMMAVRSDGSARELTHSLGLTKILDAAPLNEDDWSRLATNWNQETDSNVATCPLGVAIARDGWVRFSLQKEMTVPFRCSLMDANHAILDSRSFTENQDVFAIEATTEHLPSLAFIEVYVGNDCVERFFVHHEDQIQEQSRTGAQRKFREALSSLSFDSPDLETFLSCVDRIIFAKAEDVNAAVQKRKGKEAESGSTEHPDSSGSGFAVDISDTKKTKRQHRLQAKEDLAYLLDVLIYHLKIEDSDLNSYESMDQQGRSEEEQVGSDDADETQNTATSVTKEQSEQILNLCHRKVRTLVNRMFDNLQKFKKLELDVENVIVRLTGVLAVLREMRNCDGRQSWVGKGQTTVPVELRRQLLRAILESMFEGEQSFWQIAHHSPDLADAEDIAHLKGLLVWLAWDCGLRFDATKPFAESPEEEEERMQQNASLLAIAQLFDEDAVFEQAKTSIGPLCSGDLAWLNWVAQFGARVAQVKMDASKIQTEGVLPGDIAVHASLQHLGARLVRTLPDGDKVGMIRFDSAKPLIVFSARSIKSVRSTAALP